VRNRFLFSVYLANGDPDRFTSARLVVGHDFRTIDERPLGRLPSSFNDTSG
jgi:hypothetical protein